MVRYTARDQPQYFLSRAVRKTDKSNHYFLATIHKISGSPCIGAASQSFRSHEGWVATKSPSYQGCGHQVTKSPRMGSHQATKSPSDQGCGRKVTKSLRMWPPSHEGWVATKPPSYQGCGHQVTKTPRMGSHQATKSPRMWPPSHQDNKDVTTKSPSYQGCGHQATKSPRMGGH